MKIVYLLPLYLPSTRHVGDIIYLKKKGRIVRFLLTTLDLWKSRCIGRDVFFTLKQTLEIVIDSDQQRSLQRTRSISLSIIFNFGRNFLHVRSLNLCLSVGNSPGDMLHKVLNQQRKLLPSPPPLPRPWAVSHAQIVTVHTANRQKQRWASILAKIFKF